MAKRYPAFLLTHGSFNPVHHHHLEMMVQARKRLEQVGFEVIRGMMAITPGDRLAHKGVEALTDEHRLAALKLGCDSVKGAWLVPEPRGVEFGSGGQLVRGLSPELLAEEPDAMIFKVVGGDTALRYRSELKGPTVVVCREGSVKEVHKAVADAGPRRKRDLFLVEQLPGEECSSTKLRKVLRTGDTGAVRSMCPEPVAEYLLANRESLYSQDCRDSGGYSSTAIALARPPAAPARVAPAPGPGDGMTAEALKQRWKTTCPTTEVIGFYGHTPADGEYHSFSNFFDQSKASWCQPFDFVVPAEMCALPLSDSDRCVRCAFSEKAIMLCKAAAMGDRSNYDEIRASTNPGHAKQAGRKVKPFVPAVWDRIVCSVAFEVVYQKFSKTPALRNLLMQTGDKFIAEATHRDPNWGIGINVGSPRVQDPRRWEGTNLLGWALMEVRAALRGEGLGGEQARAPAVPAKEEFPSLGEA